MEKAILFDFFGVLCSEVAPLWAHTHLSPTYKKEMREKLIQPTDLGEKTQDQFFNELSRMSNVNSDIIYQEWQQLIIINTELVSYIRTLRDHYKIGLCTNAWSSFIRPILDSENLHTLFDTIVISSEVHSTKPDKEIYLATSTGLNTAPEECLFIDDNETNVRAAENLGMSGITFTTVDNLKTKIQLKH